MDGYSELVDVLEHYGPGPHKSGSGQDVHGGGGEKSPQPRQGMDKPRGNAKATKTEVARAYSEVRDAMAEFISTIPQKRTPELDKKMNYALKRLGHARQSLSNLVGKLPPKEAEYGFRFIKKAEDEYKRISAMAVKRAYRRGID